MEDKEYHIQIVFLIEFNKTIGLHLKVIFNV